MKDVLVTNEAEAGGVLPPNQIVVPLSSVNEYGAVGEAA